MARAGLRRSHGVGSLGEPMIRVQTEFHGVVELHIDRHGVPLLRLLQVHAPNVRLECTRNNGQWTGFLVKLSQMDLRYSALRALNAPPAESSKEVTAIIAQHFDANGGIPDEVA